jgi:hypothetical protein
MACARPPPVARTVMVAPPVAADALARSENGVVAAPPRGTRTLAAVCDDTPAGRPVSPRVTSPAKPLSETTASEFESHPGVKPVTG